MFSFRASARKAPSRYRCGGIVCWFGIAALTTSCTRFETRDVLASVLAVEGKVTVISRGAGIPATSATLLRTGDRVQTEGCSAATISLVPGARIVLDEDSELEVEKLQIHKLAATVSHPVRFRNAQVRLARGSAYASVVFRTVQPHIQLNVATPTTTCEGDPGDIFVVRANGANTHVTCAAGQIAVTNQMTKDVATVEAGNSQNFVENVNGSAMPFSDASELADAQRALMHAEGARELEQSKAHLIPSIPSS